MNWSKEVLDFLGEERVLQIRLADAKSAAGLYFYLAVALPILTVIGAYLVRASEADGIVGSALALLGASGMALGGLVLILSPVFFVPRALHKLHEARALEAQLIARGATIEPWLPTLRPDAASIRPIIHMTVALGVSALGFFVEGSMGMLLRWAGVVGVVLLGITLIFTNDVLIGGKDKD